MHWKTDVSLTQHRAMGSVSDDGQLTLPLHFSLSENVFLVGKFFSPKYKNLA